MIKKKFLCKKTGEEAQKNQRHRIDDVEYRESDLDLTLFDKLPLVNGLRGRFDSNAVNLFNMRAYRVARMKTTSREAVWMDIRAVCAGGLSVATVDSCGDHLLHS